MGARYAVVEIAVPCDEVTIEVTLVPSGGLTSLERATIGAIGSGRSSVEEIAAFLATPRRLILDVLHGLWSRGYIAIDFASAAVELTEVAQRWLRSPETGELQSGTIDVVPWSYLHEPITGAIHPAVVASRPGELAHRMPRANLVAATQTPQASLIRAIQDDLDRKDPDLASRVVDVSFGSRAHRPASTDRWVTCQAHVLAADGEGVDVRLTDDVFRSDTVRRRLERHIERLCEAEPASPFVQALVGQADMRLEQVDDAPELLERLGKYIDAAATIGSDDFDLKRKEILRADQSLRSALRAEVAANVTVGVVRGADDLLATTRLMLDRAHHQVVLASPRIRYTALNRLLPDIEAALERDVRVVILWGDRLASELDSRVATALVGLRRQFGDGIIYTNRSSRLAARIVVQDDLRALFGSVAPLEISGPQRDARFGIVIEAGELGYRVPAVIADVLEYAKNAFPNFDLATAIRTSFGGNETPESLEPDVEPRAEDFDPPPVLLAPPADAADPEARAPWIAGWRQLAEARARRLSALRGQPAASLSSGADHRAVVLSSLERDGRVVLAGRRIDDQALPNSFRDALKRTHADLTVIARTDQAAGTIAAAVGAKWIDREMESGVVVNDAEVLLTPVDLFAWDRIRADMVSGVRVRAPALAAEVALAVGAAPLEEEQASDLGALGDATEAASTVEPVVLLLELQSLGHAQRRVGIEAALGSSDDPRALLDSWQSVGAADAVLRAAAAWLVQREPNPTWTDWLAEDALRNRRFVEAWAVSVASLAETRIPTEALLLMAPLEEAWIGVLAEEASLELAERGGDDPFRLAALCGAACEVLAGPAASVDALEVLASDTPSPWRDLALASAAFRRAAQAPIPLEHIRAVNDANLDAEDTEADWQEILAAIERIRAQESRWHFATGVQLQRMLFEERGLLQVIDRAARTGAIERARVLEQVPKHKDVRRYLDDRIRRANLPPMEWRKEKPFLSKLEGIVREARRVARIEHASASDSVPPNLLQTTVALATALREHGPEIRVASESLGQPLDAAPKHLLAAIDPLLTWQEVAQ